MVFELLKNVSYNFLIRKNDLSLFKIISKRVRIYIMEMYTYYPTWSGVRG